MAVGVCAGQGCFPFREHSPSQGRWISPDPLGAGAATLANPQTWNRYAYVANNPLSLTDPTGLIESTCQILDNCTDDDGGGGGGNPGAGDGIGWLLNGDGGVPGIGGADGGGGGPGLPIGQVLVR